MRTPQASPQANARATDQYTPSGNTKGWAKVKDGSAPEEVQSEKSAQGKGIEGFDLEKFRKEIRDELLAQIADAKKKAQEANPDLPIVSDIPYAVGADEVAAEVPEEYNADNTSQRIVDFALSFRGQVKGMSDEEFISQVRSAIQEGFKLAKHDLGGLPGPVAKLFNDTYDATMSKLDKALEDMKAGTFQVPGRPEVPVPTETAKKSFSSVA